MTARRWALIIFGLFLLFIGVVFALQGANVIGGSAVMSGNSTYIYVGAVVVLVGLILMAVGAMSRLTKTGTSTSAGSVPTSKKQQSASSSSPAPGIAHVRIT